MDINTVIVISVIGFVVLVCWVIHVWSRRAVSDLPTYPAPKKHIEISTLQGVQTRLLIAYLIRPDGEVVEWKTNIGYVDLCKCNDEDILNFIKTITAEQLPVVIKQPAGLATA